MWKEERLWKKLQRMSEVGQHERMMVPVSFSVTRMTGHTIHIRRSGWGRFFYKRFLHGTSKNEHVEHHSSKTHTFSGFQNLQTLRHMRKSLFCNIHCTHQNTKSADSAILTALIAPLQLQKGTCINLALTYGLRKPRSLWSWSWHSVAWAACNGQIKLNAFGMSSASFSGTLYIYREASNSTAGIG